MPLTVTTVAPTLRLTTLAAVTAELGQASSDNALVNTLIDQASSAIVAYCHRPFARETMTETLPGFNDMRLQLGRTPVVSVTAVTIYGQIITGYGVESADRGWLYFTSYSGSGNAWDREQWPSSQLRNAGLSASGRFMDMGTPLPRQDEPVISIDYTGGYILPSQFLVAATTVSAAAADSSFNDSASGFPALLKAGDIVETSGFATAGNNSRFLVTGTPTAAKITVSGTLVNESAGTAITVKFRPPSSHRQFDEVEKACIETVKSWYSSRRDDSNLIEKQAGPMRIRYSENRASENAALPPVCVGLLRAWVRLA